MLNGWPLLQLDGWCGTLLDDVDVGVTGLGRAVSLEVVVEEEIIQGDDHAAQVHSVPGVDQLVDYSSTR